jgi:hypothetical protein
MVQNAGALPAV